MNKKQTTIIVALAITTFLLLPQNIDAYVPLGEYIWINISPPTETRLGGAFSSSCPVNEYMSGLYSNGTLICAPLPP